MFTHYYELYKRVPRQRRKVLANFIHELKCLCGRKYHCEVIELIENSREDYLTIDNATTSPKQYSELIKEVVTLCYKHSIPRKNICIMEYQIDIDIYTDF